MNWLGRSDESDFVESPMTAFPGTPRSSFGQVVVNDILYIIGGHVGLFHQYPLEAFSNEAHAVDLASGHVRVLPHAPYAAEGDRLIAHGNEIFLFGGFRHEPGLDFGPGIPWLWYARSSNEAWAYSLIQNEWRLAATLPRPRSSHVAGKVGNKAYLFGGWDGTPWQPGDIDGRFHFSVEIFDLTGGHFIASDVLMPPPQRRAFASTTVDNKIWMVCGLGAATQSNPEGDYFDEFTMYDPIANEWLTSSKAQLPSFPKRLFSPGMCALDDMLVVTGGLDEKHIYNREVFLWKKGATAWVTNSKSLPAEVTFPELIPLANNKILVVGGHGPKFPAALWEIIKIDSV
jgi:N-acetylneuraminic acid mutarotase